MPEQTEFCVECGLRFGLVDRHTIAPCTCLHCADRLKPIWSECEDCRRAICVGDFCCLACLDPSVDPSHEAIWKAAFVSGFVTGYINVSNAAQRVSERMVAEARQHASTPGGN